MSAVLPEAPARLSPLTRLQIAAVVPVARLIHRRPPAELRRRLARLARGARPARYDEAKRARDEILTASPRCRGDRACLIRSLSVVLLCRLRGVWPAWCVGVLAVPPFAAHAWVEAEGRIVDEPLAHTDYRAFFKVAVEARPGDRPAANHRDDRKEVQR
ncbi:lasso peptide biosynthesis B2 protein [Nonomuraea sp. NPDC052634]|uniref:lasso peptide biosynthesis B2 protein n=1 Tax=Nonomuraea sp. NPDC052634 TaxID=3155813 RepID=UPI00342FCDA8